jgi:ribosomal protein S18 acetylase RimI-like enzyme
LSDELRPLADGDAGWLADLHNRAFADYPLPAVLDASSLAFYMDETDVRPDLSFAIHVDGVPASFCLGAIRGRRGSIRGEGTDPRLRRRGLGDRVLTATLGALRDAGADEVGLEVLDANQAARNLYDRRGFEARRRLLGYTVHRPPRLSMLERRRLRLADVDTDDAVAALREWGWDDPPWQLQAESVAHLPAQMLGGDAVVFGRRRGRRFWLYALAVDPSRRGAGLGRAAVAALGAEWIAVPALVPDEWAAAHAFLRAIGAAPDALSQWEMRRDLRTIDKS